MRYILFSLCKQQGSGVEICKMCSIKIAADDEDQKYKEGKYILEEALIDRENWVDDWTISKIIFVDLLC